MIKKVSILGLGYIGLPTAAMFASKGIKVLGVDINQDAIKLINQGKIHIYEPGLEEVVKNAVNSKNLIAKNTPEESDAFIVAVPTPFKAKLDNSNELPKPDISYINNVIESISAVISEGNIIILESTSPVGTTEGISKKLSKLRPDLTFPHSHGSNAQVKIAYCPERVLPGNIIEELQYNDRVIGGISKDCSKKAEEVYKTFVKGKCYLTNCRTAEMVKLTENSFRDVNIAFANELSLISDTLDIDVWELIKLANKHPRVNILQPGPGVGGHCIAVDPWFIIDKNPNESNLILSARKVNDHKPHWVVEKIKHEINLHKKNKFKKRVSVAFFGITYKPNIDDLRESPSLQIASSFVSSDGLNLLIVEPNIDKLPVSLNNSAKLVSRDVAIQDADILVFLVNHDEFTNIEHLIKDSKSIIDINGFWKNAE